MPDDVTFSHANRFQRAARTFFALGPVSRLGAHVFHRIDIPVFRWTRGRHTAASIVTGLPVILLTTTGARSGKPRSSPVLGVPTSEGLAILASNFGQTRHPAWYHNLRATPDGEAVIGGRRCTFHAVEVDGERRDHVWREALTVYPGWSDYERRAGARRIPIFLLELGETPTLAVPPPD